MKILQDFNFLRTLLLKVRAFLPPENPGKFLETERPTSAALGRKLVMRWGKKWKIVWWVEDGGFNEAKSIEKETCNCDIYHIESIHNYNHI